MPLGVPKKTQKDGKCEITRALKVRPFVKGKKKAASPGQKSDQKVDHRDMTRLLE